MILDLHWKTTQLAVLSGDGKPQKTVTGKMAGRTRLHVTLPELNDKSATAEIVVTSTEPGNHAAYAGRCGASAAACVAVCKYKASGMVG